MKKKVKLTPWFPADVKPARAGVYEKDFGRPYREFQYWDGERWYYGGSTPEATATRAGRGVVPNARRWRGLAKEPK